MSLHINDLVYLRAGWQKVVDNGQYGSTIYVFRQGDQLRAVTNKNHGVGELIETITATPKPVDASLPSHGLNRAEPADFGVQYQGTGKL